MALTDVLSSLFGYFVKWHQENYEILHGGSIGQISEQMEEIDQDNKNILGEKCRPKNSSTNEYYMSEESNTVWQNICKIWDGYNGIGRWEDFSNGAWHTENEKHSLLGAIHELYERTQTANVSYIGAGVSDKFREGVISKEYLDKYLATEKMVIVLNSSYCSDATRSGVVTLYRRGVWVLADINLYGASLNTGLAARHLGISGYMGDAQVRRFKPLADTWGSHSKYANFQIVHDNTTPSTGTWYGIHIRVYPTESGTHDVYGSIVYPVDLENWAPRY